MTPEEIRKKRIELGAHQIELPPVLLELAGTDPALADGFLQRVGMAKKQGPSLMGQAPGPTTTMEGMEVPPEDTNSLMGGRSNIPIPASEYPPDITSAQGEAPRGGSSMDFLNQPSGLEQKPPDKKESWVPSATLAISNALPELIKAAYQRPERPQGRSVGGGKPAFQMADPFGKRERFRSMMAQYLR